MPVSAGKCRCASRRLASARSSPGGRSPVVRCRPRPARLDAQEPSALASARFGSFLVTGTDIVLGDDDGVVFIASDQAAEVLATARQIAQAERDQARKIQAGQTLRQQTTFGEYLARRAAEPSYTFRRHLRQIGGAIEE